jgi:hypothetical protein
MRTPDDPFKAALAAPMATTRSSDPPAPTHADGTDATTRPRGTR